MQTISSQHYLDESIVVSKIQACDFEVLVSPAFSFDGQEIRVVLDGHHSFAAAQEAGVSPVFVEVSKQDHDAIALIERGRFEEFLEATWIDGDFYNIETGEAVWH